MPSSAGMRGSERAKRKKTCKGALSGEKRVRKSFLTSFDEIFDAAKKPFRRAFLRRFQKGEKSQPCAIMPHASQAKHMPAASFLPKGIAWDEKRSKRDRAGCGRKAFK